MAKEFLATLEGDGSFEVTALFLAQVCWPDRVGRGSEPTLQSQARDAAYSSLYALLLHQECVARPEWAEVPQFIVPQHACRAESRIRADLRTLDRRVRHRLTAGHIAVAFLKEAEAGATPKLPRGVDRLSLNQLTAGVLEDLDFKEQGNVESRVWRPSLCAIHLCAAWAVSLREVDETARALPVTQGPLRDPPFLRTVLERAEMYVPLLAKSRIAPPQDQLVRIRLVDRVPKQSSS